MRIILIGQAAFGKDALGALLKQGEEIVGVLTIPDKAGQTNPVKALAEESGLPVLQPARLKTTEAINWVKALQADLLVLAFVTDFVPNEMIEAVTHGGINYHPSLLPKYRGGSAINWAIINGEKKTGVTIHFIDNGIDTGPILLQKEVSIEPDDTLKSVYFKKLYPLGIEMIPEAVRLIREGKAKPFPQDNTKASFQPVIKEADAVIDWKHPTEKIYNLIRGSNPSPGATTTLRGEKLKIWEGVPHSETGSPGELIRIDPEQGIIVGTGDGSIIAQRVQYTNTKKITASELVDQFDVKVGELLGN